MARIGTPRDVATVVLAALSGSVDAIGFVALGGAFTSVMTGNMVLIGVGSSALNGELVGHAVTAVLAFVIGCAAGARIAGTPRPDDRAWPVAVTRAFMVEGVILLAVAVVWWSQADAPGPAVSLCLLGANAVALGLQSSAIHRFGASGLSTTYMTGTLTTLVIGLATRRPTREVGHKALLITALIMGAALGALLVRHLPVLAPVLPLAALAVVLVISSRANASRPAACHTPDPVVSPR